jgi:hypothetical protein
MTPLLEVLIATYNRPERAMHAIKSCLNTNDSRLIVSCSSNGREEKLMHLLSYDKRLNFSFFETNQGPNQNWGKLLKSNNAKYCLLLSDEDSLNAKYIVDLLDWLEQNENIAVANCTVINEVDDSIYFKPNSYFQFLDLFKVFLIYPEQTSYLSGYIFRTDLLSKIDLNYYLNPTPSNVYGHINLAHKLLQFGDHGLFRFPVIIKGRDDKFGGHAYEHIVTSNQNAESKLNPLVYSSYARTQQFYYMHQIIRKSLPNVNRIYLFFYDLDLMIGSYFGVLAGNKVCGMNAPIYQQVKNATDFSKKNGEFEKSISTLIFPYLFKYNFIYIIKTLRYTLSKIRAFLIKFYL